MTAPEGSNVGGGGRALSPTGPWNAARGGPASKVRAWLRWGWRPWSRGAAERVRDLVDPADYLARYPDVASSTLDPATHYVRHGAAELRNPNALFLAAWYVDAYPDALRFPAGPLAHYEAHGWREGRNPSPWFDTASYLERYPELRELGVSPVRHHLARTRARAPLDPGVDKAFIPNSQQPRPLNEGDRLYTPLISILLPVYNTPARFLREALQSVFGQTYPHWELCIVDDGSSAEHVRSILHEAQRSDPRVRLTFAEVNGGIAKSSQIALELARGEFVAFLDHDDMLTRTTLEEIVGVLRSDTELDYVYTDHAMFNEKGQISGLALKPGWSPEFFLSTNYIVHFKVLRRDLVLQIGGFSAEKSVVQDVGLTCRMVEAGARIGHLPKVLYLWREHPQSVSVGTQGKPAIEKLALEVYGAHLQRRQVPAKPCWPAVFEARRIGVYKLDFHLPASTTAIFIIDPDRRADLGALSDAIGTLQAPGLIQTHVFRPKLGRPSRRPGLEEHPLRSPGGVLEFAARCEADNLVFLGPDPAFPRLDLLTELIGYLHVSKDVALVGGKILDRHLQIVAGAFLLLDETRTLCRGESDNSDGYWFNGRSASNVSGVSGLCMAMRRSDLDEEILPNAADLHTAGLELSLNLRKAGRRVVYNPWAKVVLRDASGIPASMPSRTAERDPYYPEQFSTEVPYASFV